MPLSQLHVLWRPMLTMNTIILVLARLVRLHFADCMVCGPGVLIELDKSITLKKFIDRLEEHPQLLLTRVSATYRGKNLYMQAPPILEEATQSNLDKPLFDLMDGVSKAIINVNGMAGKGDKKQSCMRKLRITFKGVDEVADIDMAGGA